MNTLSVVMSLQSVLFIGVSATLLAFLRQRSHFLTALLALEVVVTFMIAMLTLSGLNSSDSTESLVFLLLAVGACEASLGLGLLVAMVRAYGNDLMKSLSVLQV